MKALGDLYGGRYILLLSFFIMHNSYIRHTFSLLCAARLLVYMSAQPFRAKVRRGWKQRLLLPLHSGFYLLQIMLMHLLYQSENLLMLQRSSQNPWGDWMGVLVHIIKTYINVYINSPFHIFSPLFFFNYSMEMRSNTSSAVPSILS